MTKLEAKVAALQELLAQSKSAVAAVAAVEPPVIAETPEEHLVSSPLEDVQPEEPALQSRQAPRQVTGFHSD